MRALVFAVFMFSSLAWSQNIDVFPKDENGQITVSSVVTADNTTAAELHSLARLFFAQTFVSANDVIQLDDKEAGTVLGKGSSPIVIEVGKVAVPVSLRYTIKIESKDNRYKYTISNWTYSSVAGDIPAETFFNNDTEVKYQKAKNRSKAIMNQYVSKSTSIIKGLEEKIRAVMSGKPADKNNSW